MPIRKLTPLLPLIFLLLFVFLAPVFAAPCGNGVCQSAQGETCNTCPADCGTCTNPTPTPTTTPTDPTPTPTTGPGPGNPTPTPTTTPSGGGGNNNDNSSGGSSNQTESNSVTYYPTISLSRAGINFFGTTSVENGEIASVEYSLDQGISWISANPTDGRFNQQSENYNFSPDLTNRTGEITILTRAKSLAQVFTQSVNYGRLTLNIQPPSLQINQFESPTKISDPVITATVTSTTLPVARTQYSLDDGQSWINASLVGNQITANLEPQEDNNYLVVFRAFDIAGNVGVSESTELIIDTIPPIIGGSRYSLGPQVLNTSNNQLRLAAGSNTTLTISMKGGVTQASLTANDQTFPMTNYPGTSVWYTHFNPNLPGQTPLLVEAEDGAGNTSSRLINTIEIVDYGRLKNDQGDVLQTGTITVYYYEQKLKNWLVWEGASYQQTNPQTVGDTGEFSFTLPPGKYYLSAKSPGYRRTNSQILDLTDTTIVNPNFVLEKTLHINFQLPFIGRLSISPSNLIPKSTVITTQSNQAAPQSAQLKSIPPDITVLDMEGQESDLSALIEQPTILTFLSSWSPESPVQLSIFNDLTTQLNNVQLVTVFVQDSVPTVDTLIKRGRYNLSPFVDPFGYSAQEFELSLLPQHYFINSDGEITTSYTGLINNSEALEISSDLQ